MTEIYRSPRREDPKGDGLVVWFYQSGDGMSTGPEGKCTFAGQDFGPSFDDGEYEYFLADIDPAELRKALEIGPDDDLTEAVKARGQEIVTTGEMTWLKEHNVAYEFSSW